MATEVKCPECSTLRPDPSKRLEVPDHLYPQLRLVVQPSGARSFAVRTRVDGKPA